MDMRWYCRDDLDGFDLDLIGFDCSDELVDEMNAVGLENFRWHCPFKPGCGATHVTDCPLMKRLKTISLAPEAKQ
jgi:hypothetical protein